MNATVEAKAPNRNLRGGLGDDQPRSAPVKKANPQAVVTALVQKYGANVCEWYEWPAMLAANGVDPKKVSRDDVERADRDLRDAMVRPLDPARITLLQFLPVGSYFRVQGGKRGRLLDLNACEAKVDAYDASGRSRREGWSLNTEVEPLDPAAESAAAEADRVTYKEETRRRMSESSKRAPKPGQDRLEKLRKSENADDREMAAELDKLRTAKPKSPGVPKTRNVSGPVGVPRGPSKKLGPVFGFSVTAISHWMGTRGWSLAQAMNLFDHYKAGAKESSVKTGFADGRNPKYAKPAALTPEQEAELNKFKV